MTPTQFTFSKKGHIKLEKERIRKRKNRCTPHPEKEKDEEEHPPPLGITANKQRNKRTQFILRLKHWSNATQVKTHTPSSPCAHSSHPKVPKPQTKITQKRWMRDNSPNSISTYSGDFDDAYWNDSNAL